MSNSHLAPLSEVSTLNPRFNASLSDTEPVAFLPMSAVDEEAIEASNFEVRELQEVRKGYTPFIRDDVLVAKITPCFENGKIAIAKPNRDYAFGSTEFHVIRTDEDRLDPRYLTYFLRQDWIRLEGQRKMTGSAGQRRVPVRFLERLQIPLPPLPEQKRIAAILDKADALRTKRQAALAKLDELTQSIFLEMFGDPVVNPKGWPWKTLADVCDLYAGTTLPKGEEFSDQETGYSLLKVSDMNLPGNETYFETSQLWSSEPGAASGTCPAGSIAIPKRGGAIGTNKKRITTRPSVLDPNLMAITPESVLNFVCEASFTNLKGQTDAQHQD